MEARKIMNRKGFEFSFGWMFAIIVGAVVIFLAIYAATRLVGTERAVQDTEVARQLGILLNPLETGLEEGKSASIKFPTDVRIFNNCTLVGDFGEQKIGVSTKSGVGKAWETGGVPSKYYNKYVFSSGMVEGKEVYVFSKPFEFPYKVADLMFMWPDTKKYCFVGSPPSEIEEDIMETKPKNIELQTDITKCQSGAIKVCFMLTGTIRCDIKVDVTHKTVTKTTATGTRTRPYEGSLVYGAIFAEPDLYECQVKRLMRRTSALAELYRKKSESLSPKGCSSGFEADLVGFAEGATSIANSASLSGLGTLAGMAKDMEDKNEDLLCELF